MHTPRAYRLTSRRFLAWHQRAAYFVFDLNLAKVFFRVCTSSTPFERPIYIYIFFLVRVLARARTLRFTTTCDISGFINSPVYERNPIVLVVGPRTKRKNDLFLACIRVGTDARVRRRRIVSSEFRPRGRWPISYFRSSFPTTATGANDAFGKLFRHVSRSIYIRSYIGR